MRWRANGALKCAGMQTATDYLENGMGKGDNGDVPEDDRAKTGLEFGRLECLSVGF